MARRTKIQRERDLKELARRYLQGEYQADIAADLGVSQSTISADLKKLQRRWQASALVDLNAAKAQELAKIDNLEREYWEAWTRSCADAETVVKKAKEATQTIKGQAGDPRFLAGVQWCIERRCKLLGLGNHFDSAGAGHVQIDQDAVVGVSLQRGHGGGSVGTDGDFVPHAGQLQTHQLLERFFVVGEQQLQSLMGLGTDFRSPSVLP